MQVTTLPGSQGRGLQPHRRQLHQCDQQVGHIPVACRTVRVHLLRGMAAAAGGGPVSGDACGASKIKNHLVIVDQLQFTGVVQARNAVAELHGVELSRRTIARQNQARGTVACAAHLEPILPLGDVPIHGGPEEGIWTEVHCQFLQASNSERQAAASGSPPMLA